MKLLALPECLEYARSVALEGLESGELSAARNFLTGRGLPPGRCLELLRFTAKTQSVAPELLEAGRVAPSAFVSPESAVAVERVLLLEAALQSISAVASLAVDESVKRLFCKEFISYARPPKGAMERFAMTGFPFITMSRIALLLRYPGGLLHWEDSGFPRSWLPKIPARFLFPALRFLTLAVGAFKPYLVQHMGGTVLRYPFVRDIESRLSFYRMAAAAELQPGVRALMAGSWLLSRETHRVSPHLACLAAPFLESGGIYFELGPAHVNEGFLVGDERRKKLYEAGEYKPAFAVVLCSRRQAIDWKHANASLEPLLAVK